MVHHPQLNPIFWGGLLVFVAAKRDLGSRTGRLGHALLAQKDWTVTPSERPLDPFALRTLVWPMVMVLIFSVDLLAFLVIYGGRCSGPEVRVLKVDQALHLIVVGRPEGHPPRVKEVRVAACRPLARKSGNKMISTVMVLQPDFVNPVFLAGLLFFAWNYAGRIETPPHALMVEEVDQTVFHPVTGGPLEHLEAELVAVP